MAEGKDIPINIKTATDNSGLDKAKQGTDQLDDAVARLQASADAAVKRIDALDDSAVALAPGLADVASQAGEAEKAIRETKDAIEEHGEKSQKATEKMMVMGQISQGLAMGLNNLAEVARANGQEELANDLNKVAAAMTLVTSIAATGLQLQTAIVAAGGLQAALIGLRTAAVASLAAFGPYIAALAAGAAAYYALQKAADAYMGTVEEMDAKNARAAIAIGSVAISHEEEKQARAAATEEIEKYRDSLSAANDELERNLDLIGNEEQLKKAKINADIRKQQAEIDAQTALYERSGGKEGMSPQEALKAEQRLKEEKIQRLSVAEETRRKKEESTLQREVNVREVDLLNNQTAKGHNDMEINGSMGRYNLSADERKNLSERAKMVEDARQKHGADSVQVEEAMRGYMDAAIKMNEDEKKVLLERLRLREELSKKIEAEKPQLEELRKKLEKTQRSNDQERAVSAVDNEAEVVTSRVQTESKLRDLAARQRAAKQKADEDARDKASEERAKGESVREKRADDEAGIGRRALEILPKGVRDDFRNAVVKAARGLQDGDQGGELKELASLMNRLAAAVQVKGTKTSVDIANLSNRIAQLEKQK